MPLRKKIPVSIMWIIDIKRQTGLTVDVCSIKCKYTAAIDFILSKNYKIH